MTTDLQAAWIISIVGIVNQTLVFSSFKQITSGFSYLQCIYAIATLAEQKNSFATNLHYAFVSTNLYPSSASDPYNKINIYILLGALYLVSILLIKVWALHQENKENRLQPETLCLILYGENLINALTKICYLPVFILTIYSGFTHAKDFSDLAVITAIILAQFYFISVMKQLMPPPPNIDGNSLYLYKNKVSLERIQIAVKIIMSFIVVIAHFTAYELNYIIVGVEAVKLLIVYKLDQYQFGRALTLIRIIQLALFGLVLAFLDSQQSSKFLTLSIVLVEVLFTICICWDKTRNSHNIQRVLYQPRNDYTQNTIIEGRRRRAIHHEMQEEKIEQLGQDQAQRIEQIEKINLNQNGAWKAEGAENQSQQYCQNNHQISRDNMVEVEVKRDRFEIEMKEEQNKIGNTERNLNQINKGEIKEEFKDPFQYL